MVPADAADKATPHEFIFSPLGSTALAILAKLLIHNLTKCRVVDRSGVGVGAVALDIKTLATGFQTCLFNNYVRKINAAAHVLACNSEASVYNVSL
jgi:hypothetical protein